MDIAFRAVDADNHYYETVDACTRHLDKEFRSRGVQAVQQGSHTLLLAGGKLFRFIPNPTFDPIIVAGCMDLMFRGQVPEGVDPRTLMKVEPLRPEYRDRDARLAVMDEQGLEAVLMFPTLACGIEQALRDDIPATMATLRAFNRWLDEDWGFSYQDRIIAVPMLSLADPDGALVELEWLLERGARMVHLRPAPVPTANGRGRSFGDPAHDPVWARLAEASCPRRVPPRRQRLRGVRRRVGRPRLLRAVPQRSTSSRSWSCRTGRSTTRSAAWSSTACSTATPRCAPRASRTAPTGCTSLVKRLLKQANQTPWVFPQSPLETIQQHVWVTPYYEEDLRKLADRIGVEQVLFGSDWPHGEGLARPTDFVKELHAFSDDEIRQVMRDNCLDLLRSGAAA